MLTEIVLALLLLVRQPALCDVCTNQLPRLTSPPAVDHSQPDKVQEKEEVTACKKNSNDKFYLCNCFDSNSQPKTGSEAQLTATTFCCQCPQNTVKAYGVFKSISLGRGDFSMPSAQEIVMSKCDAVTLATPLTNLKRLTVTNVTKLTVSQGLPGLASVVVNGRVKPQDFSVGSETSLEWGGAFNNPEAELSFTNTRITTLPRAMTAKSLDIINSLFYISNKPFETAKIGQLTIQNSVILSVFDTGLAKYQNPLIFLNNKIKSTCQPKSDHSTCFLPKAPAQGSEFGLNLVKCTCEEDKRCKDSHKAITKFDCPKTILRSFNCSDLHSEPNAIPVSYLKEKINETTCEEFRRGFDILTADISEGGSVPWGDVAPQSIHGWAIALIVITSLVILVGAFIAIRKINKMKFERKKSLYRITDADQEPEGEEIPDDED